MSPVDATLSRQGFRGEALRIAKAVGAAEAHHAWIDGKLYVYADSVGDVDRVDSKWGPSVGWFQVRSLREPLAYSIADRYRYAWALLHPDYNAKAAYVISKQGTDWSLWSVYRSGRYQEFLDLDYELISGHPSSADWSK